LRSSTGDEGQCHLVPEPRGLEIEPAGVIIRGESPIFAVEVERILTAHPAVRDVAVIAVPDAELGQRVEGFVQLERGVRGGVVDELLASVEILLADYKVPESLEVVQEIPRDHLGKIDYTLLAELISGRGEHGGTWA